MAKTYERAGTHDPGGFGSDVGGDDLDGYEARVAYVGEATAAFVNAFADHGGFDALS